jgi:methionine sulfoxide reductase heme-binding subunit
MRSAKSNYAEVAVYAAVVGLLLGWRVVNRYRSARRTGSA